MDYLSVIRNPIERELNEFTGKFRQSLTHSDGLLAHVLEHIRNRSGKQMRPILTLLSAKNHGLISNVTQHSAVALELLHTASLVHDDVVDESCERRGQPSVNASYNNKVAVLVGDYILSTCLLNASLTENTAIVGELSRLGQTLAAGEILQLQNVNNREISEQVYYEVIYQKTASLFGACAGIGAESVGATAEEVALARTFGDNIGMIFQIRDDIFDYSNSKEIGKPTGNDMAEGKLTLPVIYALKNHPIDSMMTLAKKVKAGRVNADEIAVLVDFAKASGGIDYAVQQMDSYAQKAQEYIDTRVHDEELKKAFSAYLEFVSLRKS